jgi:hypothetical protein
MQSDVDNSSAAAAAQSDRKRVLPMDAIVASALCIPLLIERAVLLASPMPMQDFMTYWSAGRLFLTGGNPYSMSATVAIDRSLGWAHEQQFVMLNPPWSLPFVAPLALMPFHVAHVLCLAISVLLEAVCSLVLWRYFGGSRRLQWIAIVVLATFLPAAAAEHYGQITPLILAGITGFFMALRSGRYRIAGACLLLFALKPHLLYLVLLAILLWSVQQRRWSIPIVGALAAAGAALASIAYNPNTLGFFHGTFQAALDTDCGAGGFLRTLFGRQHVWLQSLPSLLGLLWFGWYWLRHRRAWVWEQRLPLLLLVSIVTSPYFWWHDFTIGLPAIVALAVHLSRTGRWAVAALFYLLLQMFIGSYGVSSKASAASLLWIVLYGLVRTLRARSPQGSAPESVPDAAVAL